MLHRSKSLGGDVSRPVFFLSVAAVVWPPLCVPPEFAGPPPATMEPRQMRLPSSPRQTQRRSFSFGSAIGCESATITSSNWRWPCTTTTPRISIFRQPSCWARRKNAHSWRVELLPYLDQNDLYGQYRMNEPWDSENNKKVLEQMPAVSATLR